MVGTRVQRYVATMTDISVQYLRDLVRRSGYPRVSIHVNLQEAGKETRQNRIIVKNAVNNAHRKLTQHGLSGAAADDLLGPLSALAEERERADLQTRSMSIFLDETGYDVLALPIRIQESVAVGSRFSIVELLEPAINNAEYALLTLSLGGVGLYRCSRFSAAAVDLEELPEDLCYVLRFDQYEKSVQIHAASQGGWAAGHHGHGLQKDEHDVFLNRFVEAVEPVVTRYVEREHLPLVVTGEEAVVGHYRAHNHYAGMLETSDYVDPHAVSLSELIDLGWKRMATEVASRRAAAVDTYRSSGGTLQGWHAVLPAVAQGRVQTVFVDPHERPRGTFDADHGAVHIAGGERDTASDDALGEDLANSLAAYALDLNTDIVVSAEDIDTPAATLR